MSTKPYTPDEIKSIRSAHSNPAHDAHRPNCVVCRLIATIDSLTAATPKPEPAADAASGEREAMSVRSAIFLTSRKWHDDRAYGDNPGNSLVHDVADFALSELASQRQADAARIAELERERDELFQRRQGCDAALWCIANGTNPSTTPSPAGGSTRFSREECDVVYSHFEKVVRERDDIRRQLAEATKKCNDKWRTWNTCEVASRNPAVASYIERLEKQLAKAGRFEGRRITKRYDNNWTAESIFEFKIKPGETIIVLAPADPPAAKGESAAVTGGSLREVLESPGTDWSRNTLKRCIVELGRKHNQLAAEVAAMKEPRHA